MGAGRDDTLVAVRVGEIGGCGVHLCADSSGAVEAEVSYFADNLVRVAINKLCTLRFARTNPCLTSPPPVRGFWCY